MAEGLIEEISGQQIEEPPSDDLSDLGFTIQGGIAEEGEDAGL